jgi:hypothetical protein
MFETAFCCFVCCRVLTVTFGCAVAMSQSSQLADAIGKMDLGTDDFSFGLSLAVQEQSTRSAETDSGDSKSERAKLEAQKEEAYADALTEIQRQKTVGASKAKRKRSADPLPEGTRYKKAKLRKEDGSAAASRTRLTVNEKMEILEFRYGTAKRPGHSVAQTLAKYADVTHSQLKRWKKK